MSGSEADETDVAALAALHAACFEKAWDAQTIMNLLAQEPVFVVATKDGFIMARTAGGEAEILTLVVLPDVRRHGLGSVLVTAAAARAHILGAAFLFLEVNQGNKAARAFYQGLGFSAVGVRKAYYAAGEDALILKAALPFSDLGKTR